MDGRKLARYSSSQKTVRSKRLSYYVPEDLIEEMFSWLPPESLFRFKCVCKSWYFFITSLIKDPDFVARHLHNSHNNIFAPKSLLINRPEENYPRGKDFLLTVSSDDDRYVDYVYEELDIPDPQGGGYLSDKEFNEVMGGDLSVADIYHCDGIVCLLICDDIMLWNPGLRESKLLPSHMDFSDEDTEYVVIASGFGWDPIANDYKVLRILEDEYEDHKDYKVEIYSLRTDTWKDILKPKGLDGRGSVANKMAACYRGVFYWFLDSDEKMIVSFDLHTEEFHVIPLPGPEVGNRTLRLTPWNNSIALVSFCVNEDWIAAIEMWVMKNCSDGVSDSSLWTNCLSDVHLQGFRVSVTIWKSDELLVRDVGGWFFSFNLRTKKLRKLIIHGRDPIAYWGPCVKSLISVNRRGLA